MFPDQEENNKREEVRRNEKMDEDYGLDRGSS